MPARNDNNPERTPTMTQRETLAASVTKHERRRMARLIEMHTYARPYDGDAVAAFCARYLDCLPGVVADAFGNRLGVINGADGSAPVVLWSSHTDTAHSIDGRIAVTVDGSTLRLATPRAGCLGADCTVGVWIMREMYLARTPGLYIWHHAEEVGGKGARYIVQETPDMLAGIRHAIAFDRRGHESIITHQGWDGRTASDAYARSLAAALANAGLPGYRPDDGGSFTDTAEYVGLIGECTNISVGYSGAHTEREALDLAHALALRRAMLRLDLSGVTIARKPGERDPDAWGGGLSWRVSSATKPTAVGSYREEQETRWAEERERWNARGFSVVDPTPTPRPSVGLNSLCRRYPETAADLLEQMGLTEDDFINANGGIW